MKQLGKAPGAWPLVGHAPALLGHPLSFLESLPDHGDLVSIKIGPRQVYVVCDPDLTRIILRDSQTFDKGGPIYENARKTMGNGLVTSMYETHMRQRPVLQLSFSRDRIAGYSFWMANEIENATSKWGDGDIIAVDKEMLAIAGRIVARTLFSSESGAKAVAEICDSLHIIPAGIFRRSISPTRLVDKIPTRANHRFRLASGRMKIVVDEVIDDYLFNEIRNGDLLSTLLEARDSTGAALSREELHDQVRTFLLAGVETTAALLTWIFHLIGLNPDVEAALYREVKTVLDGRPATLKDIPDLKLSSRVLSETLRLYPPIWITMREVTAEVQLASVPLHPGDTLLISPYLIHHRDDIYTNSSAFKPDRWLPGNAKEVPPGSFIPFGSGNRKCIGDVFAVTEAALALSSIIANWKMSPVSNGKVKTQTLATLRPGPLFMRLNKR